MKVTILKTRDGHLDRADMAAFNSLRQRLEGSTAPLLIHVHGGLVKEKAGLQIARRLSGRGPHAYNPPADYEQLYIVWRSGLLDTLTTNWRELHRRDRLYRALLGKLIAFVGRKLGVRLSLPGEEAELLGDDRIEVERRLSMPGPRPFEELDLAAESESAQVSALSDEEFAQELESELAADPSLVAVAQDIAAALSPAAEDLSFAGNSRDGREALSRLDPEIAGELRRAFVTQSLAEGFGFTVLRKLVYHGARIGKRVWRRIRSGRDHGPHATIVEEILRELYGDHIGSAFWTLMKNDTSDHFEGRFGSQLLDLIEASPERKIVLIGHSAGGIFVCHMLRAWAKRQSGRKADVVLMAPAVRARLFAETLADAGDKIDRFRMFCLDDQRERDDALFGERLGFLYPSSLLYIVSGLFEDDDQEPHVDAPLLGMERFRRWRGGALGRGEDEVAAEVAQFLQSVQDSQVFAPADNGPGLRSDARTHGGVDDDPLTLESIRTFFT